MVDDVDESDEGTGENVGESAPGNSVWMANAVPTIICHLLELTLRHIQGVSDLPSVQQTTTQSKRSRGGEGG